MSNTPKPQANKTIGEILAEYRYYAESIVLGTNLKIKPSKIIDTKTAKQQIQALITEAEKTILEEVHVKIAQIPDLDLEDYQKVSKVIRKLKENK